MGALCLLLAAAAPAPAADRHKTDPEYRIKAAYIYRFLSFYTVEQAADNPSQANALRLGIIGRSPFDGAFDEVKGTPVGANGRRLVIEAATPRGKDRHPQRFDVIFICRSEKHRVRQILAALEDQPVLTIADMDGFIEQGGMINLTLIDNQVRWEINQQVAQRSGIRLSSQLLRNATRVIRADP